MGTRARTGASETPGRPTAGAGDSRAGTSGAGDNAARARRSRLVTCATVAVLTAMALAWIVRGDQIQTAASQIRAKIDAALTDPPVRPPHGLFVDSDTDRVAEVWAVGDAADEGAGAPLARLIDRNRPDRVLYLGDVYETGTAEEFARNYAPTFGRFAEITAPSLGNHEAVSVADGYEPYWRSVYGKLPPSFYSFELAGWELLSLNSEVDYGPDSEQVRWLGEQTSDGGNCRLAFWHRPRYSAGTTHGDDPSLQTLWDTLSGHTRLIVNAHEHDLQRLERRQGMTQFVAGAGGRSSYPIDPSYDGLRFGDDQHVGALRLRLRPGRASYAFVSTAGQILDSGSVHCRVA